MRWCGPVTRKCKDWKKYPLPSMDVPVTMSEIISKLGLYFFSWMSKWIPTDYYYFKEHWVEHICVDVLLDIPLFSVDLWIFPFIISHCFKYCSYIIEFNIKLNAFTYFLLPCQQGRSSVNLRDPRWQQSHKIGGVWVSESLLWQTLIWALCERHLLC